jgi:hypothetical protein
MLKVEGPKPEANLRRYSELPEFIESAEQAIDEVLDRDHFYSRSVGYHIKLWIKNGDTF